MDDAPAPEVLDVLFGNFELFDLSGVKVWDIDRDGATGGISDTGDARLSGLVVFLDDGDKILEWTDAGDMNGVWDAGEGERWTKTAHDMVFGDGYYCFDDLGPSLSGSYDVVEDLTSLTDSAEWQPTTAGGDKVIVTAASATAATAQLQQPQVPKNSSSSVNDVTYVFDYDVGTDGLAGVWYEWSVGFSCFGVIHDNASGQRQLWAGSSTGKVFKLFGSGVWQDEGSNFTPTIKSAHLRSDGKLAQLRHVRASVSDVAQTLSGKFYVDEETSVAATTNKSRDVTLYQPEVHNRDSASELVWQDEHPVYGRTHQLEITFPTLNGDFTIDRLDVVFQVAQDHEEELCPFKSSSTLICSQFMEEFSVPI